MLPAQVAGATLPGVVGEVAADVHTVLSIAQVLRSTTQVGVWP